MTCFRAAVNQGVVTDVEKRKLATNRSAIQSDIGWLLQAHLSSRDPVLSANR